MKRKGKVLIIPICNAGDNFNIDLLSFMNVELTPTTNPADADLIMLGGSLSSLQNPKYAVDTTPLYIWGTGFLWGDDIHGPLCRPNLVVRALRGKLSKDKLAGLMGASLPEDLPLADPGLLASFFAGHNIDKKYDVGFIPHFREHGSYEVEHVLAVNQNLHFIDITQTPREVIRDIQQCRSIISSSLHGLIFSDSLGIPNCHVRLTELPLGGSFKFRDYYSAFNLSDPALTMDDALGITFEKINDNYAVEKHAVEEKKAQLIESFPSEFSHYMKMLGAGRNIYKALSDEEKERISFASELENELSRQLIKNLAQLKASNEQKKQRVERLQEALDNKGKEADTLRRDLEQQKQRAERLQKALDNREKEADTLRHDLEKQKKRADTLQYDLDCVHDSISFRVGRAITWAPRKMRGGVQCCRDHGTGYTVRRALYHVGLWKDEEKE